MKEGGAAVSDVASETQDEAAYLRCQVQLLNADSAESHTEIESMIQRLGLSLPDTDCLPDHAELAKVLEAEVVRLRAEVALQRERLRHGFWDSLRLTDAERAEIVEAATAAEQDVELFNCEASKEQARILRALLERTK